MHGFVLLHTYKYNNGRKKKTAGSPIFGWLGDKIKQRRVPMLLGIAASITANLMFMFAIAYWMLLLARFLQGVSNACVWTMSLCLIADNWPEDQLGMFIFLFFTGKQKRILIRICG